MKIKDGGSAFPDQGQILLPNGQWSDSWSPGMTLRDWFAGKALVGMMASDPPNWNDSGGLKKSEVRAVAQEAYQMADAMLAAREATE